MKRVLGLLSCCLILLASLSATQKYVVAELFTMTWCASCPAARSALHQMCDDEENFPYLIPLIWQGDGLHQSPGYSMRQSLYNFSVLPYTQWNGSIGISGVDFPAYIDVYNQLAATVSPVEIYLSLTINGEDEIIIETTTIMTGNVTTTNNRIVFVITYDLTGVMDTDYFASVKAYHEENFLLTTAGESQTFSHAFPYQPDWEPDKLQAVIIIQNMDTDNPIVHQAAQTAISISELPAPENVSVNIIDGTVHLNWDIVNDANSYHIFSSVNPYTEDWEEPIAYTDTNNYSEPVSNHRFFRIVASTAEISD